MPQRVPDALREEVALVASPAELPGKLRQRYAGLLQRVFLYFPMPENISEAAEKRFVDAFRAAA